MKIVIIGTGKVGQSIMKNVCQEGHDITIIDRNIEKVNNAINTFDVLGICGNAVLYNTQRLALRWEAQVLVPIFLLPLYSAPLQ